jgi:nicotinamide mononucleotide (NMN) deamidase PncC
MVIAAGGDGKPKTKAGDACVAFAARLKQFERRFREYQTLRLAVAEPK